jgi:CBS domain containing-hemolysin-like protein
MSEETWSTGFGLCAVLLLVLANGFFVAAEFALVSVRRSRVAELVGNGRTNARALQRATDNLDANLAATQLGITLASLALGWVGEPALAHLIEPALAWLPGIVGTAMSHTVATAFAFIAITALHIVLGELAPKSLALQRSETTALAVVRPLSLFLIVFRPAILLLNSLGNGVLRLFGLNPGHGEGTRHSTAELNLLIQASQEAGLIEEAQQEAVERIFAIGDRRVRDIMTPRHSVEWIDLEAGSKAVRARIRTSDHSRIVVSRGVVDEVVGIVSKQDLLNQFLDGAGIDVEAVTEPPTVVHEGLSILDLIETFRSRSGNMAVVVDEYGGLKGIVTPTDVLEAIAGEIPEPGDSPRLIEGQDGTLSIDGMMSADEGLERLGVVDPAGGDHFTTMAGFVVFHLGGIPAVGDVVETQGWRIAVTEMAGRRVARIEASRSEDLNRSSSQADGRAGAAA